MQQLLRDLLEDLGHRCDAVRTRLVQLTVAAPANDLAVLAAQMVLYARREVTGLLADAALDNVALVPDHLRLLRRRAQEVQLAEHFALPHLERFNQHDADLSALAAKMIQQCGLPLRPPLVTASSTQHYWTNPGFYLISVPAGETGSLLGLSDLAHELGHILMRTEPLLPDGVAMAVNEWFDDAARDARTQDVARADQLEITGRQWTDDWMEEFVCDVLATYVAGRSFGFQHIRLCALLGADLCSPILGQAATHPADEARMRLILATLTASAPPEDTVSVKDLWDRFTAHQPPSGLLEYQICYPDALLELVATEVVGACRSLGIVDSNTTRAQSGSVTQVLDDAWTRFFADSGAFVAWETANLAALYVSP